MAFIDSGALAALSPVSLDDAELMAAQRSLGSALREIESAAALVAAEIGRRSSRERGYAGLAQRLGARTPERLVQELTGSSLPEARRLVRVGTLVESAAIDEPWMAPALDLGVAAIDAIRLGLGSPTSSVGEAELTSASRQLAVEAASLDVDGVARRARQLRTELDVASVALREKEMRDEAYVRFTHLPTGMVRLSGLLDPESAAVLEGAADAITAPRRGGPRFVSDDEAADDPAVEIDDDRTPGRMVLDALVDLVHVATKAPSGKLFGKSQPGVRVLVTARDLAAGEGVGVIEGQSAPVSVATVERLICSVGVVPLLFDQDGRGIDEGRNERYHTPKQRRLIAARDGHCKAPGCDRPPAWCEVHHIVPWSEGGGTNVDDGVLLCRFHHMMVHNNGWRVIRSGCEYSFVPPALVDPLLAPIALPSTSVALRRLRAG